MTNTLFFVLFSPIEIELSKIAKGKKKQAWLLSFFLLIEIFTSSENKLRTLQPRSYNFQPTNFDHVDNRTSFQHLHSYCQWCHNYYTSKNQIHHQMLDHKYYHDKPLVQYW